MKQQSTFFYFMKSSNGLWEASSKYILQQNFYYFINLFMHLVIDFLISLRIFLHDCSIHPVLTSQLSSRVYRSLQFVVHMPMVCGEPILSILQLTPQFMQDVEEHTICNIYPMDCNVTVLSI